MTQKSRNQRVVSRKEEERRTESTNIRNETESVTAELRTFLEVRGWYKQQIFKHLANKNKAFLFYMFNMLFNMSSSTY